MSLLNGLIGPVTGLLDKFIEDKETLKKDLYEVESSIWSIDYGMIVTR